MNLHIKIERLSFILERQSISDSVGAIILNSDS